MYCVKCGVKLADGQSICPICHTEVYHPDIKNTEKNTYPKIGFKSEEFNPKGVLFVITIILFIVALIPVLFELTWHFSIAWSGYAAGGVMLAYVIFVLPFWFKNANPVIFVPCDFAAITLYVGYINLKVDGDWFLTFSMPITLSLGLIVTAVVTLFRYVKHGRLYMVGGGMIGLGVWTALIEFLIYVTFGVRSPVIWSSCSFATLFLFGMMLIVIAIVKPLKESLRRIFFVGSYNSDGTKRHF